MCGGEDRATHQDSGGQEPEQGETPKFGHRRLPPLVFLQFTLSVTVTSASILVPMPYRLSRAFLISAEGRQINSPGDLKGPSAINRAAALNSNSWIQNVRRSCR